MTTSLPVKVYLDSETCGLHSMPVLFQFAYDDGPIHLFDIWREPIKDTLTLIEWWCRLTVVGFNLTFDWFHVVKLYNVLRQLPGDWIPQEHIEEIAAVETSGKDGPCVKPAGALDLLLHSRKGPYQALMSRDPVRIRRVPTALAYALRDELEKRIEFDSIYFAKVADKTAPRWKIYDIEGRDDLKNVVLKFRPAGGLKYLAEHAIGYKPEFHYADIEPPREWLPVELGYAPTADVLSSSEKNWEVWVKDKATGKRKLKGHAWPAVIQKFIDFWATNENARQYANDDIVITRDLDKHFGYPMLSDDDSILACMVAAVRWHGFEMDLDGIKQICLDAKKTIDSSPVNTNKPSEVRAYLSEVMSDLDIATTKLDESTKKQHIEKISKLEIKEDEECSQCWGMHPDTENNCKVCGGTSVIKKGPHPAAARAKEILDVKVAEKRFNLFRKLYRAKRFHPSFTIVGTKSNRMSGSGSDGVNPQGINRQSFIRKCFPLKWEGMELCGGDFDAFEVTLADAVYDDEKLRETLVAGKKIHALFAQELYPGMSYEDICATKDTEDDLYGKGKAGIFAMVYGGDHTTLMRNLNIPETEAQKAFDGFGKRYPGIGNARERTFDRFCTMRQPGGPGTAVYWKDPDDYVESFLKFRRYFTLENKVCKQLFQLAQKPPSHWRTYKMPVSRSRERIETAAGAVASALYGCAFGIQQSVMRAAANHEIQSPGGQITKTLQRMIWEVQPAGVHEFRVLPLNVHDEVLVVTDPTYVDFVGKVVRDTVERFRPQVPLIAMKWNLSMDNWAEKKGGSRTIEIGP